MLDARYRIWRPRQALDIDGQGNVFQRRMPPCGAQQSWPHWDYDDQLTDFHSRLTQRGDGTVFATQLAIYPSSNIAAGWMGQFQSQGFACSTVRTPRGDVPVTFVEFSSHDPGLHALGMDRPWGRVQIYRPRGGPRGGAMTMAFRKGNAVLLVTRCDQTEVWPPLTAPNGRTWGHLQFGAYHDIAQFARPAITLLHRYYS